MEAGAGGHGYSMSLAQLTALAKDNTLQLRALRCEHDALRLESEALRRCLDRAGVLPSLELEEELECCGSARLQEQARSLLADRASPWSRTSSPSTQRAGSPCAQRGVSPARGPSQRGRSVSPLGGAPRPSASRTRSRSFLRDGEPDQGSPDGSPEDLHEALQSALDDAFGDEADRRRRLRALSSVIQNPAVCLDAWAGPGPPLNAVVKKGRTDIARLMLRARANPSVGDDKGVTPLHLASFDGNQEMCKVLLVARANVDACDRHGQTPLFFAPCKEICKMLMEKRADVSILNRKGQSALHLAGRNGLSEVFSWLAARVSRQLVDLKDVHGCTARSYMQQSGSPMVPDDRSRGHGGARASSPPRAARASGSGSALARHVRSYPRSDSAPPASYPQRRSPLPVIAENGRGPQERHHHAPAPGSPGVSRLGGSSPGSGAVARHDRQSACEAVTALQDFAAAAMATAAVATAAKLERSVHKGAEPPPAHAGEAHPAPKVDCEAFEDEADEWPLQAASTAQLLPAPPAPRHRAVGEQAPAREEDEEAPEEASHEKDAEAQEEGEEAPEEAEEAPEEAEEAPEEAEEAQEEASHEEDAEAQEEGEEVADHLHATQVKRVSMIEDELGDDVF